MRNQRKAGVILSYLSQGVNILSGLLYTPIMLRLLGQSEYGVYQLVYSVISYLSLLNLGFNASYMRFYSRSKANNDEKGIAKLNGMFMLVFCIMSVICVICGSVMLQNIGALFSTGLTDAEYILAKRLMLFMIVNLALTFPNSVFTCIITAHEEFVFQKLIILLQGLLHPFLTLPLLLLGYGSIGMVSITTLLTVMSLASNCIFCLRKLGVVFCFRDLRLSLLKEMWTFTFFIFLNEIINQINWNVDKFLLGRMMGTVSVAVYGIGGQINTLYMNFSTSVSNVFAPKVNQIVAESDDNSELSQIFAKVGRIQFIILTLILSGFIFFGQTFIRFWAGSGYAVSYYVSLLLIIPATIPFIQNIGIEIQRAKNKHKARSIVYFFIAIGNIFLSIPLIKLLGPVGAALGTAIALFAGNCVFMNWYYAKRIGLEIGLFWREIGSSIPGIILPIGLGILSMNLLTYHNVTELIIGILLYTIVYCISMYLFGMNKYEKDIVKEIISKIFIRKRNNV